MDSKLQPTSPQQPHKCHPGDDDNNSNKVDTLSRLVVCGPCAQLAGVWSMLPSRDALHCLRAVSKAWYKASSEHIREIYYLIGETRRVMRSLKLWNIDDAESLAHKHHHRSYRLGVHIAIVSFIENTCSVWHSNWSDWWFIDDSTIRRCASLIDTTHQKRLRDFPRLWLLAWWWIQNIFGRWSFCEIRLLKLVIYYDYKSLIIADARAIL